jgi:Fe-S cluster assembly protein SufD
MTTTELKSTTGFDVGWADEAARRASAQGEPAWAAERRRAAAEAMRGLELPRRDHELWRRTDFGALEATLPKLDPFVRPAETKDVGGLPRFVVETLGDDALCAPLIVQVDGGTAYVKTNEDLAAQGVVTTTFERAARDHERVLRERFGAQLEDGYDWYTAAGAAIRSGGTFVYVPAGVEAADPIRIVNAITKPGVLAAPRTVIVLGTGARATVIDQQLSETLEGASLHLGGVEVWLEDEAKLVYATLQEWGRNVYHYSNHRARVGRDAELQWVQTMLGARVAKANAYFDLAGPGAQAFVHGFMFGDQRQHFHLHTLQRHQIDHTTSDLLIKSCLRDRARSVYQGLIQVSEGAQRTDAYQANRNLLLSNAARADSIPGLEILANDVRCTHGATIGHVDPDQLYYLMARGLPRNEAQRLIVEGFFAPVLDRIPLDAVREQLRREIERKIG